MAVLRHAAIQVAFDTCFVGTKPEAIWTSYKNEPFS
jgi:hypothetical protein